MPPKRKRIDAGGDPELDVFYNKSKFLKVEEVPSSMPCTLTNAIHPLFQHNAQRFWAGASRRAFEVPTRLASRLLQCPSIQPIFHAILGPDPDAVTQTYPRDASATKLIGPGAQHGIRDALIELATMIKFTKGSANQTGPETVASRRAGNGNTDPVWFTNGIGSHIRFGHDMYAKLLRAGERPNDVPALRVIQFQVAFTMVHEVVHAMVNARLGEPRIEPYFSVDDAIAEAGFEAEARMFGGIITHVYEDSKDVKCYQIHSTTGRSRRKKRSAWTESSLSGALVLYEWPQRDMPLRYEHLGMTFDFRRELLPQFDLAWRVPLTHIAQFLDERFWRQMTSPEAWKRLHPRRDIGHGLHLSVDGVLRPLNPSARDLPEGYGKINTNRDRSIVPVRRAGR